MGLINIAKRIENKTDLYIRLAIIFLNTVIALLTSHPV